MAPGCQGETPLRIPRRFSPRNERLEENPCRRSCLGSTLTKVTPSEARGLGWWGQAAREEPRSRFLVPSLLGMTVALHRGMTTRNVGFEAEPFEKLRAHGSSNGDFPYRVRECPGRSLSTLVFPAKAGIQGCAGWVQAFARVTERLPGHRRDTRSRPTQFTEDVLLRSGATKNLSTSTRFVASLQNDIS
jgi:hypothetical protein